MTRNLPERGEALPGCQVGPFTAEQISAYAIASFDSNPVHTDVRLALSVGLDGVPVQGMLIMGQFETVIGRWRPDALIRHLDARFIRPLMVDRSIQIGGRVVQCRDAVAMVRLTVTDEDGGLVCVGGARVSFSRK